MYRTSYYDRIIDLIRAKPMSQNEIRWRLRKEKITVQGVANHLEEGIKEGKIIYLGNLVSKKDARYFLRHKFNRLWPFGAWQCYVYMPETEKMYIRLKEKLENDERAINAIIKHYRELEFASMFQGLEFYNFNIVKKWKRFKKTYTNDEEVRRSITKKQNEVKEFFEKRDRQNLNLEFLQLTPIMYWCAFKRALPVNHPKYDKNKDIIEHTTIPMFNKLRDLFVKSIC